MRIINTSAAIADLLPEVCYALDPDGCFDLEFTLPIDVRRYIKNLIMAAFSLKQMEEVENLEWLLRIRTDPSFVMVSGFRWVDLDVIDAEGTFVLIIEER